MKKTLIIISVIVLLGIYGNYLSPPETEQNNASTLNIFDDDIVMPKPPSPREALPHLKYDSWLLDDGSITEYFYICNDDELSSEIEAIFIEETAKAIWYNYYEHFTLDECIIIVNRLQKQVANGSSKGHIVAKGHNNLSFTFNYYYGGNSYIDGNYVISSCDNWGRDSINIDFSDEPI